MAGRVNEQTIDQIRERTDIVDVIGSRIQLRRSGSDYTACCPFHHEKTPSFHVNPSRQTFKCFGCGVGGDVFSFLMKHDGMTFGDALRTLGERCGIEVEFSKDDGAAARRKRLLEINAEAAAFYGRCLAKMAEAQAARDYLASRDLGPDMVEAFQIGYAPRAEDTLLRFAKAHNITPDEMVQAGLLSVVEKYGRSQYHDRFRGRLMFTICDAQGRAVAFSGRVLEKNDRVAKYVNSPETPVFQKSSILYALHRAQRAIANAPNRRAIVCEGQIDTIRCHAAGFQTAVASQGTAFTEEHVRILKRYADSAVMVFDSDKAGQKAAVRTAGLFLAAGVPVRAARLPAGEDPDSFIRANGAEAFAKILDEAEEIMPFQFRLARSLESDPDSADALGRISAALLETVGKCGNAVHRARMLQEAAALLHLPESALEEELGGVLAANAKRAERDAAREAARGADEARRQAAEEIDAVLVPQDEMPLPGDSEAPDLGFEGAAPPPASLIRPDPAEIALCELLMQGLDDDELTSFVATYAPEDLFAHPYCRALAHAVYLQKESEGQSLADVQSTDDAELTAFVGRLATAPERVVRSDDVTPLTAARDLVLNLWRRRLRRERDEIAADANPESVRRRQALTLDLRRLDRWDSGEPVILRALAPGKAP